MIPLLACAGVVVIASYLLWLAWVSLFKPERAMAFLELFASSARVHFIEMGLRIFAGVVLLGAAPRLAFGEVFYVFGVVLVATSVGLVLFPWRWHRKFARKVIPEVIRRLPIFGIGSFLLGAALVSSVVVPLFDR